MSADTTSEPGPIQRPITAEMVKKLRDQTGAGMMECKARADRGERRFRGSEHDPPQARSGDRREKGRPRRARGSDRAQPVGRPFAPVSSWKSTASPTSSRAPTTFSCCSRTCWPRSSGPANERPTRGSRTRTARSASASQPPSPSSGENMAVPRFVRYAGRGYVGQYIHLGGKLGVQVEFAGRHARHQRP